MSSNPSRPEDESASQAAWAPLTLPGIAGVRLTFRFDYTEDPQALILSVRLESSGYILRYGMSRRDIGSAWQEQTRAERRLKALAEAQLKKDLYLLLEEEKIPRSHLQIEWINFQGRTIG